MLNRYYDTMRTPTFIDLFEPLKLLNEVEGTYRYHRADTIDEEGIKIELPGVKPSDVDISVENKTLKVTGKSRHNKEFSYSYVLKSNIDDSAITANLQDGLLTITLPKKPESAPRKITITT